MFGDGSLTLREFAVHEPLPLAVVQGAILEFLRHRPDAVLFGSQAVNAYVSEPRMTQDVDILAVHAGELADELRDHLRERFHIAVRVRRMARNRGFRIFQSRQGTPRHLADIRMVDALPPARKIGGVAVLVPEDLIAAKVIGFHRRSGQPKAFTDRRDIAVLLLRFPHLRRYDGVVRQRLEATGVEESVLAAWRQIAGEPVKRRGEGDEF
ncbi:MAG: hypothetical protein M1588_01995 [Planctomycetes bacterium]|nr:hypothetical protein [Planctomycetota bacterium]